MHHRNQIEILSVSVTAVRVAVRVLLYVLLYSYHTYIGYCCTQDIAVVRVPRIFTRMCGLSDVGERVLATWFSPGVPGLAYDDVDAVFIQQPTEPCPPPSNIAIITVTEEVAITKQVSHYTIQHSVDQSPIGRVRRVLSQAGETRIKGLGG